jgi:peptide/nickel transport system substrate-binding protein
MIRRITNPGRRRFLREATLAGAALAVSPLANPIGVFAQSTTRSRIVIAHGVGVYSLNPYAVNTSPLVAAWGSIMEPLIDADYEKRGYRGVLAESWQMTGTKLHFKLRKGIRFHDGTPLTSRDVIASF